MMKVKITKIHPGRYAFKIGDVLEYSDKIAKRLIDNGIAEPVKGSAKVEPKRKKAVSQRGKKKSK